jgi:hypothetical protein
LGPRVKFIQSLQRQELLFALRGCRRDERIDLCPDGHLEWLLVFLNAEVEETVPIGAASERFSFLWPVERIRLGHLKSGIFIFSNNLEGEVLVHKSGFKGERARGIVVILVTFERRVGCILVNGDEVCE